MWVTLSPLWIGKPLMVDRRREDKGFGLGNPPPVPLCFTGGYQRANGKYLCHSLSGSREWKAAFLATWNSWRRCKFCIFMGYQPYRNFTQTKFLRHSLPNRCWWQLIPAMRQTRGLGWGTSRRTVRHTDAPSPRWRAKRLCLRHHLP
jgi:hypothetical protein